MLSFIKRISRFESRIDASIEKFIFHHKILGLLMIFIAVPLATLAAVCACTTVITLPVAFAFGWV